MLVPEQAAGRQTEGQRLSRRGVEQMGVWKVSDADNPAEGKAVITIANTDTGVIAIAISGDSAGIAFVPVETAERIRIHLSAAINAARGYQK